MALWTPAEISTALWLDASDSSTITIATGVSQWADKSGNSRNASQATAGYQPAVLSAELNGLNVIKWDGTDDHLNLPTGFLYNATEFSFFIVHRGPLQSNDAIFGPKSYSSQGLELVYCNTVSKPTQLRINGADKFTTGLWNTNTTWAITSITANASAVSAWKNGTSVGTPAAGISALTFNNVYSIGRYADGYYADQSIFEIVICSTALSTENRQRIEGYLHWKAGLEANLPADHPYKSAAPTLNKVSGVVTVNGSPAAKTVAVFRRSDFTLLGTTTSDASTGAFEILGVPLDANALLVTAIDSTGTYNAVSVDYITSVSS